jgi:hypothetical protein
MGNYHNASGTSYVFAEYAEIDVIVYVMKGTHYLTICPDSYEAEFASFDAYNLCNPNDIGESDDAG